MAPLTSEHVDRIVADFWYGDVLPFNLASSPRWLALVGALKCAPPTYKSPSPWQLRHTLLDKRHGELKSAVQMESEYLTSVGVTFTSDGWEDVADAHKINFCYVSPKGSVFHATEDVSAEPTLDAAFTAKIMIKNMRQIGPQKIVLVVTDTCATMKAAWKLIEQEFPHVTCAGCGPHVLNLLMKDLCKLPAVESIIADIAYVSKWFTNKKWRGITLRKRLLKKHSLAQLGKSLKCKKECATRFGTLVILGERLSRLQPALQSVVVDREWKEAQFHEEITDDISEKLLDTGWWATLDTLLALLTPVKQVLRVLDSNKPTISKIYDLMYSLGVQIGKLEVPWQADAVRCFDERWVYLHSPIHAAGYALDPEYLETIGSTSSDVMEGLFETVDRLSLLQIAPGAIVEPTDPRVGEFAAKCEAQYTEFKEQRHPIFKRSAVGHNRKELPPYKWWQLYCNHLPELQSVAIRVLSQVAAASICERNWSIHGMVHSKGRYSLQPQRAIKLVFNHQSLRLMDNLKDPNWKEEPIAWLDESSSNPDADSE